MGRSLKDIGYIFHYTQRPGKLFVSCIWVMIIFVVFTETVGVLCHSISKYQRCGKSPSFSLTMKRGFLLGDGKKLSINVKDKEFAKTVGVSTQVLDPDLGVTMVKVETGGSMDVKVNSMMMVTSPLRPNLT